jgi:hypothetical protein
MDGGGIEEEMRNGIVRRKTLSRDSRGWRCVLDMYLERGRFAELEPVRLSIVAASVRRDSNV